jgi:glycosyltransferase involved in cell wall biosynthesis
MHVTIDLKCFSGHQSGIAGMFEPLIQELANDKSFTVTGIMPNHGNSSVFPFEIFMLGTTLPSWVPGVVRSVFYDLFLFPRYIRSINPSLVLSPYFDVHIPKKTKSIITIHDMCFFEVPKVYGVFRRSYFRLRTKLSARNAIAILTDSQASKSAIVKFLSVPKEKIHILPNRISQVFMTFIPSDLQVKQFRSSLNLDEKDKILLYSGGFENRKNLKKLFSSFEIAQSNGWVDKLLITGTNEKAWLSFAKRQKINQQFLAFTGQLDPTDLRIAYASSNALIYPSLSEGFGRPNLEALYAGIPVACSDIPVFREVCGDNADYFDPEDIFDIASSIGRVMSKGHTAIPVSINTGQGVLSTIILNSQNFK